MVALFAISATTVSCKKNNPSSEPSSSHTGPIDNDSGLPTTISYLNEPGFQIHFQREDDSYKHWGLWLWSENAAGGEYPFNYSDDYGVIAYYPISQFGEVTSIGLIVKQLFSYAGDNVWKKDYDADRFIDFEMLQKDEHDIYHVYLKSKSGFMYTDKARTQLVNAVNVCEFNDSTNITVSGSNALSEVVIKKNDVAVEGTTTKDNKDKTFKIKLSEAAKVDDVYTADITFSDGTQCTKSISIRTLYDKTFESTYAYEGDDLGATYTNSSTTFKVWSPVSREITLRIYNSGTPKSVDATLGDDTYEEYPMTKGDKGVFSVSVNGDLGGKYYTYFVKNSSFKDGKEIVDPYAKGAGVNGLRGMIVDFSKTNPEGWGAVTYLDYNRKELTVYETHIAELTCSDTWGGTPANAKKYPGFYEAGTTYTKGDVTVKTGFDHIKELGVNAVQIIPFFDQANDEINTSFNWGYNPLNYNVVEGCYSTNPYDGYVRIRELKSLIQAYNEEGIEIIMDVVYNHINGLAGSNFDVLMPYYYFRYTDTGAISNGSGCGNETASDKVMFRKFMIDSIAFWTKEYKLGGFRFDLMGLHDVETMNLVAAKAKSINPDIKIWGEPWAGGTSAMPAGYTAATQGNTNSFVGYGQFNDQMRDEMIKSGMNTVGNKGWVTQDEHITPNDTIMNGIKGWTGSSIKDPDKTVSYATCHDNYTLNDRAVVAGITDAAKREKMNVLANSIVFTSQGTTFMLAGEEMLRTKVVYDTNGSPKQAVDEQGNPLGRYEVTGNSYSSPYKTNELNYEWKIEHQNMFETYKKLISLRQNVEDLKKAEPNSVESLNAGQIIHITFKDGSTTYDVYHTNGVTNINDSSFNANFTVNVQGYNVYLDTLGRTISGNTHHLEPFETLILYK